jgi:Matrixin/Carboxypeptidase regulatory-like domain
VRTGRAAGRRTALVLAVSAIVATPASDAHAYLKLGAQSGSSTLTLKWAATTARYFISDVGVPGVSPDQFRDAVGRAFDTWQQVPTSSMTFQFGGFTVAQPLEDDNASTLGFLPRPDLDRVLASTSFLVDTRTGEILESDIFFNSAFQWSIAEAGEPGRFDLQSIATHEIGHFQGLGHSAIGETEIRSDGSRRLIAAGAVMFPIAFGSGSIQGRSLLPDDVAGVSDIYPDGAFRQETGSIQGRVTRNGAGVFGAHVVAFNPASGTLVGNFTLDSAGGFVIAGLAPGVYVVRVEPLDDADLDSFFENTEAVDVGFKPTASSRLVAVPRGGASADIEIQVVAK